MGQFDVDLLPDAIRARSRAHVRSGRYAIAAVVTFALVCTSVMWSRLAAGRAADDLRLAEAHAAEVLALEEQAALLRSSLQGKRDAIDRYNRVELPLRISSVLATVINELPASVCLDQIAIEAGHRRNARTPRSTGGANEDAPRQRLLTAELVGFAVTDAEIAELVDRLGALSPIENVNLDFSRSRFVRERSAREFRLSFRVDLDASYEVTMRTTENEPVTGELAVETGDEVR